MSKTVYNLKEMMCVCCAHEINNNEVVFVGIGLPMMGAQVAKATHAQDSIFLYEAGGVGSISRRVPWSISDNPTTENALVIHEMWRLFSDGQVGLIDRGLIGGAQIDKYGNLNTTVILGGKTYDTPKVRLPGSGGANDIGASCLQNTIVMTLEKGKFVKKVDYITTVGHLTGAGSREKAGLTVGNGPTAVITQYGIFRFDEETKEMYLAEIFPDASVEEIRSLVEWDLKVSPNLTVSQIPTEEELHIIHTLDPMGITLGAKPKAGETFEEFYEAMLHSYETMPLPKL